MNKEEGIHAIYKYLYSDFIVQEISLSKEIAYISP